MALFLFARAFLARVEAGAWLFHQGQLCSCVLAGRCSRRGHLCLEMQEQPPAHGNLQGQHKAVPCARSSPLLPVGTAGQGRSGRWGG